MINYKETFKIKIKNIYSILHHLNNNIDGHFKGKNTKQLPEIIAKTRLIIICFRKKDINQ